MSELSNESPSTIIMELSALCDERAARIAELEEIVERLPKTKDGVPCLAGDRVFALFPKGIIEVTVINHKGNWWAVCDQDEHCPDASMCYSTRETAEAAAKQNGGK